MTTATDQTTPKQTFYCSGCQQWHEVESLLEAVRRESEKIEKEKDDVKSSNETEVSRA